MAGSTPEPIPYYYTLWHRVCPSQHCRQIAHTVAADSTAAASYHPPTLLCVRQHTNKKKRQSQSGSLAAPVRYVQRTADQKKSSPCAAVCTSLGPHDAPMHPVQQTAAACWRHTPQRPKAHQPLQVKPRQAARGQARPRSQDRRGAQLSGAALRPLSPPSAPSRRPGRHQREQQRSARRTLGCRTYTRRHSTPSASSRNTTPNMNSISSACE